MVLGEPCAKLAAMDSRAIRLELGDLVHVQLRNSFLVAKLTDAQGLAPFSIFEPRHAGVQPFS